MVICKKINHFCDSLPFGDKRGHNYIGVEHNSHCFFYLAPHFLDHIRNVLFRFQTKTFREVL